MCLKPYTVIAVHPETQQTVCDHVEARNGLHAFHVAAPARPEFTFVVALPGHRTEGAGELVFPGETTVDAATVLEQPEVFAGAHEDADDIAGVSEALAALTGDHAVQV